MTFIAEVIIMEALIHTVAMATPITDMVCCKFLDCIHFQKQLINQIFIYFLTIGHRRHRHHYGGNGGYYN